MALRMGLSLVGLIAGFGAGFGCTFAGGARGNIPVLVVGCVFIAVFIASFVALILLSLKGQAQAKRWLRLTMDTLGGRPMPGTVSLRQLNEELRGVLFFEVRKVLPNGFELSVKLLSIASAAPLAPPENAHSDGRTRGRLRSHRAAVRAERRACQARCPGRAATLPIGARLLAGSTLATRLSLASAGNTDRLGAGQLDDRPFDHRRWLPR